MWHNVLAAALGIILLEGVLIQPALAQGEYPTKPIEIIVQATPGSSSDYHSRLVAEISKKYLGQPFVVVNKPGAGGAVAAADILSSKPDGHKLIWLPGFLHASRPWGIVYP